jgi:hypothetical protein
MAKSYTERLEERYKELRRALTNQDAVRYRQLCDELNYTPETDYEEELYNKGRVVRLEQVVSSSGANRNNGRNHTRDPERAKETAQMIKKRLYKEFLKEVEARDIPAGDITLSKYTYQKKELLQKYFPEQYEKQNLDEYNPAQIGRIWNNMISFAKEKTSD